MHGELIERLRTSAEHDFGPDKAEHDDWKAADTIEALAARNKELEEALRFYRDEWEQEVDAERTAHGWTGSIGDVVPTDALMTDEGKTARQALGEHHAG
jgi:hypothetical protein